MLDNEVKTYKIKTRDSNKVKMQFPEHDICLRTIVRFIFKRPVRYETFFHFAYLRTYNYTPH